MTDIKNTIHRILNKDATPQDIMSIVRDALKMLMPLVKAYLDARAKYNRSSSIKNGSEMQEARNAVKTGYDNILNGLLNRQATEWKDTITARELEDMIESEFRNISTEDK